MSLGPGIRLGPYEVTAAIVDRLSVGRVGQGRSVRAAVLHGWQQGSRLDRRRHEPVWSGDGHELFYRNGDHIMTAAVTTQPAFRVAKPARLFDKRTWTLTTDRNVDVLNDGRRFLMIAESEQVAAANHFNIVLNWFEELKRLVSAK